MLIHPMAEHLRGLGLTAMADAFIDMQNNSTAGDLSREDWLGLLLDREATSRENKRLGRRLRQARLRQNAIIEDTDFRVPRGLDLATRRRWQGLVESELARARRGDSVLDDYARTNEVELFAVAVEWFFKAPRRLRARHRELYDSLAEYLGQEPAGSR